jgi:hypothetical protein
MTLDGDARRILGLDPRICGRTHVVDLVSSFPRQQMLGSSPSMTTQDETGMSFA